MHCGAFGAGLLTAVGERQKKTPQGEGEQLLEQLSNYKSGFEWANWNPGEHPYEGGGAAS